jgi:hypothetical protein
VTNRAAGPVQVLVAAGLGLAALCSLVACNSVTYDATATTSPRDTTTTVYVPTGTPAELLASIATRIDALSEQLVDGEGQRQSLARIEAEWAAVRPVIATQRPALLPGFDAVLAQVQRAVDRRRPADADKAAKNLAVLIHSYEG